MKCILYPSSLGQLKNGVKKTPGIMKDYIYSKKIYNTKCNNNIYQDLKNLYHVNKFVKGKRLNIGGDHSMSIATVAYSLNNVCNLKVLWFDAHADINTTQSSNTNNYHGMPLGFLTGLDNDKRFSFIKNRLKFENILYIGLRDVDDFEGDIIDNYNIKYITCSEVNKNPQLALSKIQHFIKDDTFHLSFDVDCMDPSIIPSTGTPVKDGLKLNQTQYLLNNLLKKKSLLNTDLTELNLDLNKHSDSLKNTLKLISPFCYNLYHFNSSIKHY